MKKKESISLFEAISRGRGHRPHPEMSIPEWIRKKAAVAAAANPQADQPSSDESSLSNQIATPTAESVPAAPESPAKPITPAPAEKLPSVPPASEVLPEEKSGSPKSERPKESAVTRLFGKLTATVASFSSRSSGGADVSEKLPLESASVALPTVSDEKADAATKRKHKAKIKKDEHPGQGDLLASVSPVKDLTAKPVDVALPSPTSEKKSPLQSQDATPVKKDDAPKNEVTKEEIRTQDQPAAGKDNKDEPTPLPYRSPVKPANMYPNAEELKMPESLVAPSVQPAATPEATMSFADNDVRRLADGYGKAAVKVNPLDEPIFSFSSGLLRINLGLMGCIFAGVAVLVICVVFFILGRVSSPAPKTPETPTSQTPTQSGNDAGNENQGENLGKPRLIPGKFYAVIRRFNGTTDAERIEADKIIAFLKAKGMPADRIPLQSTETGIQMWSVLGMTPFDSDLDAKADAYKKKIQQLGNEYYRISKQYDFQDVYFLPAPRQ